MEGDHPSAKSISKKFYFYPRPPGGGRPFQLSTGLPQKHFYPRPPGGGRRAPFFALCSICRFLSTPSGWRATRTHKITEHHTVFLSTPSGWRATHSIYQDMLKLRYFYPRPPGGGRQVDALTDEFASAISIHALRVEGDCAAEDVDFAYGGFLSTPSGWRATKAFLIDSVEEYGISIHALRVEGDHQHSTRIRPRCNFYPRPPGGGRQQKRTKFSSVFAKKGEEFASLRRGKRKICRWRFKKDKFWVLIWCEGSRKSVCALASHCG